ncbi:MAG: hypothetical protein OEX22_08375 [Cyclobacteriaceae bacterium]|nr:hypothetical protein [Cyclobacteriaceae bacterium]
MKNIKILIVLFFVSVIGQASAQYRTGDDELNRSLVRIDAEAKVDFGAFKVRIGRDFEISSKKLDNLSVAVGMSAGDIYMSVKVAKITNRNIDEVVKVYTANKNKGWGVMAKELGIKPGSPEFHALKGNTKGKNKSKGKSNGKGKSKH